MLDPTSIHHTTATVPPRFEGFAREMARNYCNADWPEDTVYSVMADILRVIGNVAKRYTDISCPELLEEELEAEGRKKVISLFVGCNDIPGKEDKQPILERIKSRSELFAFIATCLNNHTRGLVHRHRFTAKRTGSRVPPKGSPDLAKWSRDYQKPEISLDAFPELRSRREFQIVTSPADGNEITDDMEELLTPMEYLVFQQFTHPNTSSLVLATVDAWRGKNLVDVHIKTEHQAGGLGISVEDFEFIWMSVRTKFEAYRMEKAHVGVQCISPVSAFKRELFTSTELLVYQQLVQPNRISKALAEAAKMPMQIDYLAAGVGMTTDLFSQLSTSVKTKLMDNSHTQTAVAALESIFEVQVPKSLPALVVRRLFTLAARSQFEKITDNVAELLRNVGAEVPVVNSSGNLTCFGILFSRNHHVCSACQARNACSIKSANFGLDQVTLSPTLLSARASVRTAELIGNQEVSSRRLAPVSEREEEIRSYLEQHFKRAMDGGEEHYRHNGDVGRNIVWLGSRSPSEVSHPDLNPVFLIRFCNPSVELQRKLIKLRGASYLPESMPTKEVFELISGHADVLYASKMSGLPTPSVPVEISKSKVETSLNGICNDIADRLRHILEIWSGKIK